MARMVRLVSYMAGRVSRRRARDFGDMLLALATLIGTREMASLISFSDKYAALVFSGKFGKKSYDEVSLPLAPGYRSLILDQKCQLEYP